MKKMWKLNNKAVSPVIATILMVAITVVLAAVLYVMVMGFGGDAGNETPTGSFTMTEATDGTHQRVTFGVLTPEVQITDLKIVIDGTTYVAATTAANVTLAVSGTPAAPAWLVNVYFIDLANDGRISAGDYLDLKLLPTGTGYTGTHTVSMIFTETGDLIDDITFTK